MRRTLLERLKQDLVGPMSELEELASRPSDVYLTGVLWPRQTQMPGEEDESMGVHGAGEPEGVDADDGVSLAGQHRPCAAGVSFAAVAPNAIPSVEVNVEFACYERVAGEEDAPPAWHRRPFTLAVGALELAAAGRNIDLEEFGASPGTRLHVRTSPWQDGVVATVTLLNYAEAPRAEGRNGIEARTLFQVEVLIRPSSGTQLVARPSRRTAIDDEDHAAELLHRHALEFATGHTCSARWVPAANRRTATEVATTWVPSFTVPSTSPDGHAEFDTLRTGNDHEPLAATWLADADSELLEPALLALPAAYARWLKSQADAIAELPSEMRAHAERNVDTCRRVHDRMAEGASRIASDPAMATAFRLANKAMALQYCWSRGTPLQWRPFQLGFILLSAASLVDGDHPDREVMDLLWFPTGGGKTEAYLALIAFLAFYRRLSAPEAPDSGAGVAALMRYTLRLLTTQQFTRAAAMILACEAIRRGQVPGTEHHSNELGHSPFSIGLWVGGDASPNYVSQAAAALDGAPGVASPKQLLSCPACTELLSWRHNHIAGAIEVRCTSQQCVLFDAEHPLPVWTVDEDVYREKPTLVVGTIDKFAQIVRRKEITDFLGLAKVPPDLVLQDELHLISGPLGTVAGLYEAAIDRMLSEAGQPPKIIGSTATIRRASDQVLALFKRGTEQFPPPCLDGDDSGFAVVDPNLPGRLYAGVTTAGRSAKFMLQATAASLLQSSSGASGTDKERDWYWTLISYFNALRELGGALVLMQDDVTDSIADFARRRGEEPRDPAAVTELTSRLTQEEVRDMLERLDIPFGQEGILDAVLATNMLSVGVDIPRLGLMLVNGQPKGIAEYIQATSRVGRGEVPGLVVAVLNNAKARDRSHYESFATWHGTLYRDVEPTSVTPFASRARDRALHAVLVALVRNLVPGMRETPKLDDDSIRAAHAIIDDIARRAGDIDPDEHSVTEELHRLLDTWQERAPSTYWNDFQPSRSLLQSAERAATLRALGRRVGDAWPTMNNMRSVEPSTPFKLKEGLRPFPESSSEEGNTDAA